MKLQSVPTAISALLLVVMGGCAATLPPQELVDARNEYARVSTTQAVQLAPVKVHDAQLALERAERAFSSDPDAQSTRDFAYVAQRRAQIADAEGRRAAIEAQNRQALAQQRAAQNDHMRRTDAELAQTRRQLDETSRRANMSAAELAQERTARQQAEAQAAEALESLRRVASVTEESRGTVITLSGAVLFASGESTLLPVARTSLEQVALMLVDNPGRPIIVEGHTDSRGSARRNEELGQLRAQAVRDFLVSKGVPAEQIRAEGIGPARPVADNRTAEGRANNRRVEIVMAPASTASR